MWIRAIDGQNLLITEIPYFGRRCLARSVNLNVKKAWGVSSKRPEVQHGKPMMIQTTTTHALKRRGLLGQTYPVTGESSKSGTRSKRRAG
jgi:hypothetical protein